MHTAANLSTMNACNPSNLVNLPHILSTTHRRIQNSYLLAFSLSFRSTEHQVNVLGDGTTSLGF